MSRTSAQRSLLFVMLIVAGLIAFILNANTGVTQEEAHSQVRMEVDPNVLPVLQPDGTEKPAVQNDAMESAVQEEPEPKVTNETEVTDETEASVATPEQPAAAPVPAAKPAPPAKATTAGNIKSIKLNVTDTGFTITILANRPIGDTTYMNLSNPRRLVIDLREKWTAKIRNVIRTESGPVKHIVLGSHPDRLRLVVHFRIPPARKMNPTFERKGNSLTVSVPTP